jgi:amidophosphoribosyltransferase
MQQLEYEQHGVREECGVFGAYDRDGGNVAPLIYYGLCSLQHRGQESCGIAVSDTNEPPNNNMYHKDLGLVSEVFKKKDLDRLHGNIGIGHCRYSTTGAPNRENAQPLVLNYIKGTLALAHNGNLVNTAEIRHELEYSGAIFHTTTDSELIAYLIARERVRTPSIEAAVKAAAKRLEGGFALVVRSPRKLIAVRDPLGLKPLCIGVRDNTYVIASESCALQAVGATFVRDIEPGEILTITRDDIISDKELAQEHHARCVFEYIYFARLDSTIDGVSVYDARIRAGKILARTNPVDADIVAGVPDSGLAAARGYALGAHIPFEIIFYKNSYIGRTFIKPTQEERETSVKLKLSVLAPAVKGKRIVLVDDSIVRGTTMANLITMLKQAGAKEVHVRISAPPFLHPCYYGTDVPSNKQLIASSHSEEEIRRIIGADSLAYMRIEDLPEMSGHSDICAACFDANYPTRLPIEDHMRGVKE